MKSCVPVLVFLCAALVASAQSDSPALARHIEAAQQAQAQQDCGTAAKEYAAAARLLPSSGELRTNYGIALYCNNQFAEAQRELQHALSLKPALTVPHLFLGLAAFHLSDFPLATRELEAATRMMPNDANGNLWLGYTYLAEHRDQDAITRFKAALALQPASVDARYALGETYFALGRSKARQLEDEFPHGRGLRLLIAQEQVAQGDASGEPRPDVPNQWASAKEEQLFNEAADDERSARTALQEILDSAPESDRAHEIKADALSVKRDNAAAIQEYQTVLQKNPGLPGVRLAMANCMMQTSQFREALNALTKEQELQPHSAEVLTAMGRVQLALGKDEEAVNSLHQALALPGHPPSTPLLLGRAELRLGNAKDAIAPLTQAVREGADSSTANYLLARAYRSTGDRVAMAKALQEFRRVSTDEKERQAATVVTSDPKAIQDGLTSQELSEAANMPHPETKN